MFYIAELYTRSIVADSRGLRHWEVNQELAQNQALALQQNNPLHQFAVVPMADHRNAALHTICVQHNNPLVLA